MQLQGMWRWMNNEHQTFAEDQLFSWIFSQVLFILLSGDHLQPINVKGWFWPGRLESDIYNFSPWTNTK